MSPARKATPGHESWDAFWAQALGGRKETIRGIEVPVPTDMPLAMERRIEELSESEAEEDLRELIAMLFGADVMDAWVEAGMGALEFQTVLAWGMAQASGRDLSFAEALEIVQSRGGEGKRPGPKGPNRATRRASATKKAAPGRASAAGGGRSSRTSSGSTGSARRTSRS